MATEVMTQIPVKPKVLLPSEDDLEGLVKLQHKWEEKTKSRKTGKTFFSGNWYLFIQNFPHGYHRLGEISYDTLSPRTIEKHIECLMAVGILEKDEKKRVSLTSTGKKIAKVLHKYDQNILEEHLLNRLEEIKLEYPRKHIDITHEFREKLCGHCKFRRVNKCLFRGHCERRSTFFEFFGK